MAIAAFLAIFYAHFFLMQNDSLFNGSHEWEYEAKTETSSYEGHTGPGKILAKTSVEPSNGAIFNKYVIRFEKKVIAKDTIFFILKASRYQGKEMDLSKINYADTAIESEFDTLRYYQNDIRTILETKSKITDSSDLWVHNSNALASGGLIFPMNLTSDDNFNARYVQKIGPLDGTNSVDQITGGAAGHYWGTRTTTSFSLSKFDSQTYIFTEANNTSILNRNIGNFYTPSYPKSNIAYDILGRTGFANHTTNLTIQNRQKRILFNKYGMGK